MTTTFKEFALEPALQASLTAMNFDTPTPIQAMAIPLALEGRDLLGSAQTGTGKTAAFCVPMLNYLLQNDNAHALVMLPTRELAAQVHEVARKMIGMESKGPNGIKTALLIGGEPIGKQYAQLDRRPRLIVGTPGRINDHLRGNPDLVDRVSFVVLDEADRMLDMGFSPQIDSILSETAMERQTLMFSATFPENIVRFSKQYLNNPERISAGTQSKPGENIVQENMDVAQEKKYDELKRQLETRTGSVIVFVRTQHSADKISDRLNKDSHTAEAIHGGLRQRQRDKVIMSFRKSHVRVLVATDVAARGLDVPHIEHVINYDLPQVAEDYIHRIGRTARAGAEGNALSFISPGERHLWRDIDRMMNPGAKGSYESTMREEGGKKSGGRKSFGGGGGKKFGGGNGGGGYGNKDGYARRDSERSGGGFGARKPFGRADRQDRKEGGYNPAADFDRADRPARPNGEHNYANNPESYKRTSSSEGRDGRPFKKTFTNDRGPRQYNGDRPFRKEGGSNEGRSFAPRTEGSNDRPRQYNGDRPQRTEGGYQGNRDGGFKKPYNKDGAGQQRTEGRSYAPRSEGSNDRPRQYNGDRPQRTEGGYQGNRDGGFKKPYNKDGAGQQRTEGARTEGGFKKPFNRDDRKSTGGGEQRPFRKDGPRTANRANSR